MSDLGKDIERAIELREQIEAEPATVAFSIEELLELAHTEEWSVQRTAIHALGTGLRKEPVAGVPRLSGLVRTALDETVPSPDCWREGLVAVADTDPEAFHEAVISGFSTVPPDQRDPAGEECLARGLERISLNSPTVLTDTVDDSRAIYQRCVPEARVHLLGMYLTLVNSHRDGLQQVVSDALVEFETGTARTRCVASDLLCALSADPEDGPQIVETIIRWLATHPQKPSEQRPHFDRREPVMRPSLAGTPPRGILGVTQVLARIAEETPAAVLPHCKDIAASLTSWETTRADQWPRSHLTRALAAVSRQRPQTDVLTTDDVATLLSDDSEFVRYWAAQSLMTLAPVPPDDIAASFVGTLLTDTNPDIRGLGVDFATENVATGHLDSESLTTDVLTALSDETNLRKTQALEVLASIARYDPGAVQPAVSTSEELLDDTLTARNAATVLERVAEDDPTAVTDVVPTLVDCLFADAITVRDVASDTLATIGTTSPWLLDDHLSVMLSVIEQESADIDAVGDVLATVPDRHVDTNETVFEFVHRRSTADEPTVRQASTQLLGAFAAAETRIEAVLPALEERIDDTDQRVQEVAVESLGSYVANTAAASPVRSYYSTGTDHWQAASAEILARATLLNASWPSAKFQCWLADRLHESTGQTRRSFIETAGYICGEIAAEGELVAALLACLEDRRVAESAFSTVRGVVTTGETTVPDTKLATAIERVLLDPSRDVPPACLTLLPYVVDELSAPQRVADQLVDQLSTGQGNAGQLSEALAELASHEVTLPETAIVTALQKYAVNELISPRDWTCRNFGRVVREIDAGTALRETFVPMLEKEEPERQTIACSVFASVADAWPTGIEPVADRLRMRIRVDSDQVSSPALSALVTVGREFPAVLHPIAGWLTSRRNSSEGLTLRRRRYEAIWLLAADGADFTDDVYRTLRAGLLDNDAASREFALQAVGELGDPRLIPVLTRLNDAPDWGALPKHYRTRSEEDTDIPFEDFLPQDEQTVTAGDVLDLLEG